MQATLSYARQLDQDDELARFRGEFVFPDPDLIYMDGNSLGRLPKRTVEAMQHAVETQWGDRLIRSWNEGWYEAANRIGAKLAGLIGAHEDEVVISDSTSVNLFKLAVAYNAPENTWVNFKLWGLMGLMFVFMLGQFYWLHARGKLR